MLMDMRLAQIRQQRGLSQRDLAEMVGLNASTVHRAEVMHPTAKLSTLVACAAALNVSLADLFDDERDQIEAELLRMFRAVPPDRRDDLWRLLRLVQQQDTA